MKKRLQALLLALCLTLGTISAGCGGKQDNNAAGTETAAATETEKTASVEDSAMAKANAGDDDAARIAVMGIEDTPGMPFKIFNVLAKKNVNVDMILQSVGHNDKKDISFTVKEEELDIAVKALEDYLPDSYYEEIKASKEVAKVSIIGKGLLNHYGMAARMFNALYKAVVNIRMISTSEIRVTVLVNQEDMVKAMNAAHEEFEA